MLTASLAVLAVLAVPGARAPAGICCPPPTELAWSPDGTKLLVAQAGHPLLEVDAGGDGGVRKLAADDNAWYRTPRWSPDGSRVAATRLSVGLGPGPRIEVFDASAGQVVAILTGLNPAWSPDGSRLAYTTLGAGDRPSITIAAADGSGARVLGLGTAPSWRPDGLAIAFERDYVVRTIGVDGSAEVRIGEGERPLWSPDGSLLAFSTADGARITRRDGTLVRFARGAPVAWLSEGRLVLWRDNGTVVVDVVTGRTIVLSQAFGEPSRDGRRLAVLLAGDSGQHLYAVAPGDRGARRLELDPPACAGRTAPCRLGTDRADRLVGSAARDLLFPGAGDDVVLAGAGHDRINAAFGADKVQGGPGNDVLSGGPGDDRLLGGPGSDSLVGDGGRDLLDGGDDRDSIHASGDAGAPDTIRCGRGRDTVSADRNDRVAADCERVGRSS